MDPTKDTSRDQILNQTHQNFVKPKTPLILTLKWRFLDLIVHSLSFGVQVHCEEEYNINNSTGWIS